jgi:hypothetical protein
MYSEVCSNFYTDETTSVNKCLKKFGPVIHSCKKKEGNRAPHGGIPVGCRRSRLVGREKNRKAGTSGGVVRPSDAPKITWKPAMTIICTQLIFSDSIAGSKLHCVRGQKPAERTTPRDEIVDEKLA